MTSPNPFERSDCTSTPGGDALFATTHWSVVLSTRDPSVAGESLSTLCQRYWFPLYAHVRRRGHSSEDARDLTQGFFAELLARNAMGMADPKRGRFRTFLLAALDNYLHHTHRDARARKRGGDREFVSWDAQEAEQRLEFEPRDERSPDLEFDRRWALAVLERARSILCTEFSVSGRTELFELLRPHLFGDSEGLTYARIATELNMTVVAIKVTIHRLRQRYGEILRNEVTQTLGNPDEIDAEVRHLLEVLRE